MLRLHENIERVPFGCCSGQKVRRNPLTGEKQRPTGRVLCVKTLAAIVSTDGYETRTAYSAEQVFEVAAEWVPDLAIIDVVLPRMNGIELGATVQSLSPDSPRAGGAAHTHSARPAETGKSPRYTESTRPKNDR